MNDASKQIESLRERIQSSEAINQEDRDALLAFSDRLYLLDSKYSDHRHLKLLRHCTTMAEEVGGLADALEDRTAAESLVRWIKRQYDNEYTKKDFRIALRMFGEHTTDGDGKPDSIEWIPTGTSKNHSPVPDPAKMLEWEADVLPMIEASRNARDAALIAVAFDSGARSTELKDLTIGNVSEYEHGLRLLVDGKTGQRSIGLIPSVPYLRRWLSDHPDSNDPDAPLWSKLSKPEAISYRQFLDCFEANADRANVTKPVTPTNFRKSNATFLARKGMTEAFINDRQGRSRQSSATQHYVARFGNDADDQYARLHDKEVELVEDEPIGPLECPQCKRETPRHEDACVWCGQALDYETIERAREDQKELRDAVFRIAQQNPDLLDDVQRARDLSTIFESNPGLYDDARKFIEAVDGE